MHKAGNKLNHLPKVGRTLEAAMMAELNINAEMHAEKEGPVFKLLNRPLRKNEFPMDDNLELNSQMRVKHQKIINAVFQSLNTLFA